MTLTADKVNCGLDLADLLLSSANENSYCNRNQLWTTSHDTLSLEGSPSDDFLDVLLGESDSSTAASPLWSPCTTDSGINDEPVAEPSASLPLPSCKAFQDFGPKTFHPPSTLEYQPPPNETTPYVSIDLGWESGDLQEQFGIAYYLTKTQPAPVLSSQSLTVKDLLLSNLGHTAKQMPQNSLQELVLNDDEKKLLAKEGVNLSNKLPLSKSEERVLKKIRRKIRNKRSAQESRKKRREYIDSLEGRMSVCSANNLQLQRKIQQLEETNNALLEQLTRLQALLPSGSGKTARKGTCILVLLLSFSLLISSNLRPEPYSLMGRQEYTQSMAVASRSLQWVGEVRDPPSHPLSTISRGLQDDLPEKL
ncbi:cyclic AMP-responsive element-binding protein 3-like protein 3-A [Nelusetta ayraudi]|uniref:cyclic AMP-responsive element-binding protein 3-like protein 3-A n=1 Tax=Nelusetta ayraudi TaxID=303726 RepID=UPI003F72A486